MGAQLISAVAGSPTYLKAPRLLYWTGLGIAVLPVALLVTVIAHKAINIPVGDDFFSLLPFLSDWQEHTSFSGRWQLLTEQFFGHRLIFTRLVALVDFYLFPTFSFVALQVLGWIGWIAVTVALVGTLPAFRSSPWLALPVTLLLMHVEGYTNLLFAIGMGNLWVTAFAFGAAWCAFSPRRGMLASSLVFAVLASLSFVNGLLAFPAVLAGLLLRRCFRSAMIVAGLGVITWLVYLYSYCNPLPPVSPAEIARKAAIMAGGWVTLGRVPKEAALYAGGLVLLGAAALLCNRRLWQEQPAHASFLLFVVMSIFTAARGRSGWDDYYMLQDRYRIYGLLVLAIAYAAAVQLLVQRRSVIVLGSSFMAAVYCTLAYATFYPPLCTSQARGLSTALNWPLGECVTVGLPDVWPDCGRALKRAERLGIYRLPDLLSQDDLDLIRRLPPTTAGAPSCGLEPKGESWVYSVMPPANSMATALTGGLPDFGVLVLADRRVILPVDVFRVRFAELLPRRSLFSNRYGLFLPRSHYSAPGRVAVYALRRDAVGRLAVTWSGAVAFP